ncbi:hypothetical protein QMK50_24295 [Pseudomonas sp. P5_152]|uniref:hypothetical protein n=1 Tax=Pseudomonas sp. P5_152 TaxID=3043442 RepID=UPI002A359EED|nr:hypothetical protein [Pseudomonas sp. P5_152]MDX9668074.1 hypothetical protein [Pseudomonas sp. P5_152]
MRVLMFVEVLDLDEALPADGVASDETFRCEPGQQPFGIDAITIGKQFTLDTQRAILKAPCFVSEQPEPFEQQRQHWIGYAQDFVLEEGRFYVSCAGHDQCPPKIGTEQKRDTFSEFEKRVATLLGVLISGAVCI